MTPFEQQAAGKDDVPEWVAPVKALLARTENYMAGAIRASGTPEYRAVRALIAAHEPAPVDPLAKLVGEYIGGAASNSLVFDIDAKHFADFLRARGVTTNTAPVADERN